MHHRMSRSTPNCDNQKCLQTVLSASCGANAFPQLFPRLFMNNRSRDPRHLPNCQSCLRVLGSGLTVSTIFSANSSLFTFHPYLPWTPWHSSLPSPQFTPSTETALILSKHFPQLSSAQGSADPLVKHRYSGPSLAMPTQRAAVGPRNLNNKRVPCNADVMEVWGNLP